MNITGTSKAITQSSNLRDAVEAKRAERAANQLVPVNKRANRRAADRAWERSRKKGARANMQRQLDAQRVAKGLRVQFDILDRKVPSTPAQFDATVESLGAKIEEFVHETKGAVSAEDVQAQLHALSESIKLPQAGDRKRAIQTHRARKYWSSPAGRAIEAADWAAFDAQDEVSA